MIEITSSSGQVKHVVFRHFSALEGWDMQHKFIEFAASTSKEARRAFTMEVLSYATVVFNDRELPLSTDALIDNHLESWQNVQKVFEGVLEYNGIDPKTHANNPSFWSNAGAEIAISFIAECSKLMGPAFEVVSKTAVNPFQEKE
jgi:hypothetical protein